MLTVCRPLFFVLSGVVLTLALGGCATAPAAHPDTPTPAIDLRPATMVPTPRSFATVTVPSHASGKTSGGADERLGIGALIDTHAAQPTAPQAQAPGTIVFNFDHQPIAGVVQVVLGKILQRTYSIAPGVKGEITFATSVPVSKAQTLPILEMLLSWTGNALIEQDGTIIVTPLQGAAQGVLVPSLQAPAPESGAEAELFPLNYIGAAEMAKLLTPFARPHALLLVDPAHNLLVLQGSPAELAGYAQTIRIFDVDWLRNMSVGVYTLHHATVKALLPQLEDAFGPKSATPMAGLLHFLPLERANAIGVLTPQPAYLDEIHTWIRRMDRAAQSTTLHVYAVQNIKATDLAADLSSLFGGSSSDRSAGGSVAPGLRPVTLSSPGASSNAYGNGLASSNTLGGSGMGLAGAGGLNPTATPARVSIATPNGIHMTAIRDSNQLLVRCSESQWHDLLPAIQALDVAPVEVEIQTRILEVELTGEMKLGVQWYLSGLIGTQTGSPPNTSLLGRKHSGAAGLGGAAYDPANDALFYSFVSHNIQGVLHAIETNANTRVLSTPSLVVLNNHEASITVGDKIPVIQNYISGGLLPNGSTGSTGTLSVGEVQYISTGIMLDVRPRVNPGGRVYLDLDQVVSQPGVQDAVGNYTILNRQLATSIAMRDGETVLLGGLIQQNDVNSDAGVPFLTRIPVLGRLFGTTDKNRARTELILLITPHVIPDTARARAITREYEQDFQGLGLHQRKGAH